MRRRCATCLTWLTDEEAEASAWCSRVCEDEWAWRIAVVEDDPNPAEWPETEVTA
jgi:hypothetical protein